MPYPLPLQPTRLRTGGIESVVRPIDLPLNEWRDGVQPTFQCNVEGGRWGCEGSSDLDLDAKPTEGLQATGADQYPTLIHASTTCNVGGTKTVIGDRIEAEGRAALDRVRGQQLAELLYYGTTGYGTDNVSFEVDGVLAPGSDLLNPAGIVPTIQGLLETLCTARDQRGVLHVPAQYLPYFLQQYLVEQRDGGYFIGNDLQVSFDCYVNLGPDAAEDSGAGTSKIPLDDEFWMYLTAQPLLGLDPNIMVQSFTQARTNNHTVVAEQGAILILDECQIVAAKAKVCA